MPEIPIMNEGAEGVEGTPQSPAPETLPEPPADQMQVPTAESPVPGAGASPETLSELDGEPQSPAEPPVVSPEAIAAMSEEAPATVSPEAIAAMTEDAPAATVSPEALAAMEEPDDAGAITADVTVEDEGDGKPIFDLGDAVMSAGQGPYDAVNSVLDLSYSTGRFVSEVLTEGWDKAKFVQHKAPLRFGEYDSQTLVGEVSKGLTQWATGFALTGLAGKALSTGASVASGARTAFASLGKGAVVDSVFFDRQEERLSNFVEQFPELQGPITDFLQARPDDTVPEAMLKMAAEGAGLGIATDAFIAGLRCLRSGRKALSSGESKTAMRQYQQDVEHLDSVMQEHQAADGAPAQPAEGAPTGAAPAQTGEAAVPAQSPDAPADKMPVVVLKPGQRPPAAHMDGDKLLSSQQVLNTAKQAMEADWRALWPITDNINLQTEIFQQPSGSDLLLKLSDAQVDHQLKAAGPQAHKELIASAREDVEKMGFSCEMFFQQGKQAVKDIQRAERVVLKVRALMHNMTDAAIPLARRIINGTASERDKASFDMLARNLQEFIVVNGDLRTVSGRLLNSRNILMTEEKSADILGKGPTDEAFLDKMASPDTRTNRPSAIVGTVAAKPGAPAPDGDGLIIKDWKAVDKMTEDDASRYLLESGIEPQQLMQAARDLLASDTVAARSRMLQQLRPGVNIFDAMNEIRINGMLSGPMTHLVNMVGTGINTTVMKPVERIVGGALSGDMAQVRSGINLAKGMWGSSMYAFKMAAKAWKLGDNILDSSRSRLDAPTHQLTYERIKNSLLKDRPDGELTPRQEQMARAIGWIGTATRIPTRLLLTEDEFFKQVAFRGQLTADLAEEALTKGLKGKQVDEYIAARMDDAFTVRGTPADNTLARRALDFSRDSTWTSELEKGSFGKDLQSFASRHPSVRLIVPFIRTPMNLFHDAIRHTPASLLTRRFHTAIRAGGEARAEALGRLAVGSMMMGWAASAALEGTITGRPPENPRLKEWWKQNNIKPYSIKIGDKWYEYRRFDPFGLLVGMGADLAVYGKEIIEEGSSTPQSDPVWMQLALTSLMTVTEHLKDKSYFQGIAGAVTVINEPERGLDDYFGRTAASFVPYSGSLRFMKDYHTDTFQREADGFTAQVLNATPFTSDKVPLRYNWLTGEPVSYAKPFNSKVGGDAVTEELLRLGEAVFGKPEKAIHGVTLTPEQYSRFCQLHGTIKISGKTLHDALAETIAHPRYDQARRVQGDAPLGEESPRSVLLNRIIDRYREVAKRTMLAEDPGLLEQVRRKQATEKLSRRGAMTKDNQQGLLQQLIQ